MEGGRSACGCLGIGCPKRSSRGRREQQLILRTQLSDKRFTLLPSSMAGRCSDTVTTFGALGRYPSFSMSGKISLRPASRILLSLLRKTIGFFSFKGHDITATCHPRRFRHLLFVQLFLLMAHMHLVLFPGLCCPPATASLLCPMGASLKSLKVLINHARSFSSGGF